MDTGGLEIVSDDPDEFSVTLNLKGTGEPVPTPDINLNPASLDSGVVTVGDSTSLTAQIENLGNADLTVNDITLSAGDRALSSLSRPRPLPSPFQWAVVRL